MNKLRNLDLRWILAIYWIACFTITHMPPPPVDETAVPGLDKAVHFAMYAVLAALLGRVFLRRGKGQLLVAAAILAAYGAADELTQPYFQRHADWFDWGADMLGVAAGLTIAQRRVESSGGKQRPTQQPRI